ncbi:uncharacterized protein DEA37_0001605 [Paragonimus westermani]|uniref:ATP-citrate synthase/succinyl-CoA ligase C-terminal domain-containing protein n=1 Tax=Paragonimus westermani TaxID=34504 RepID=A0A5J4NEV0_9TREM|nr:uncharacterized protein DEA37_0001605 [Paragonimus westermani]
MADRVLARIPPGSPFETDFYGQSKWPDYLTLRKQRSRLGDPRVECILINIFGGIVNCNTVAEGLINAFKAQNVSVPVVARLQGTNSKEAAETLRKANIGLIPATSLDEAARMAVSQSRLKTAQHN